MFTIKSYIQHPKRPIYNLKKVDSNPLYYFIDIDNTDEILQIKNGLDLYYTYGVVHLHYYDQIIIDFTNYDLICSFWEDFLLMIEKYLDPKKYDWCVQNQPILIKDISHHGHILFSINATNWKLPKYDFLNTILYGAKYFFEKIIFVFGETSYLVELKRIKLLQQQIKH
jgi:hypothetical protein